MKREDLTDRLDEFIRELRYQEKSQRTISKYKTNIEKFIGFLHHNDEITKDDVLAFKEAVLKMPYKPATVNSIIVATNKYLKWFGAGDMKVKKLKEQQKSSLESVVSLSDYNRLLRFAKRMGYDDVYLIMKIITTTGIRISELQFFTVETIQSYYIHVRNKGKDRDVILTNALSREIKRYCRENHILTGKIFTLNESTIWRRMKRIAGSARVNKDNVHAHSFRHLFAKEYMEQYNNALELADLLGHSRLETTMIYTRSTSEEKRKKLEKIREKQKHKSA